MSITKRDIEQAFPLATNIKQIGQKQLFLFELSARAVLCSYRTIVAVKEHDKWQVTPYKYTRTTSKQITQFMSRRDSVTVSEAEWLELLEALNITQ